MKRLVIALSGMCWLMAILGCNDDSARSTDEPLAPAMHPAAEARNSTPHERQAFFGDLHIHSSWSIDAYGAGVRTGPDEAYRYAQGQRIPHVSGAMIQLAGPPLDFMALTDHAEYLGVIRATQVPVHPLHALGLFQNWMGADPIAAHRAWARIHRSYGDQIAMPTLISNDVVAPAWRELVALADRHDQPGRFSAFVGFEYSSNPDSQNLHRNVLFRGSSVPARPFSAMDSNNPEDLWRWMDEARGKGDDLIAIPHNANGSNGLMFAQTKFDGSEIDRDWIDQRFRNEPVTEIMQIKGQSETRPRLSPNDEWADFEVVPWRTLNPSLASRAEGSYLRRALETGLLLDDRFGRNPYTLGVIGSTDGHNASSPFEEANYTGKIGKSDGTPESRLASIDPANPSAQPFSSVSMYWGAAGLAGIWADANTRADLFDALRRRETFSTSGPRIRVRLFGGWHFEPADLNSAIARRGYASGVPMGATLPAQPSAPAKPAASTTSTTSTDPAPTFLLAALKDPLGADLERIQIIKGWTENDTTREQVFDVACGDGASPDATNHRCPNRARSADLETCRPDADFGTPEFNSWWRDPSFRPSERAFYYVRVLQVPTCRWSTFDAIRLGRPVPANVPSTLQERAITSPIWYAPS